MIKLGEVVVPITRALVGRGSGGSMDPPLFERKQAKIMIFFGDHTDPTLEKKLEFRIIRIKHRISTFFSLKILFENLGKKY